MRQRPLLRILGLTFGLAVILGGTIGVGILRTPGTVAGELGTRALILTVWTLGGLYTLIGASCFAELGTALPKTGGYYVYSRRAFGERFGFLTGWTDWVTYCAVLGYISIATGEFSLALVPELSSVGVTPLALAALSLFVLLQWMGLKVSSRAQEITSLVKFIAFLALVAACFRHPGAATAAEPVRSGSLFFSVVLALQSVIITYGGWQSALYFAEEDKDPAKNLPRSMIGGVAIVVVVYLLVNLALLHVLPIPELAGSKLPAADAAQAVFGAGGQRVVTLLSLISLLPLLNAILMVATRILYALGRDVPRWSKVTEVSEGGTPVTAMLLTAGGAAILAASGTFEKLVAIASFFLAANYFVCCVALLVLRKREPNLPRPFRAWGYPASAIVVALVAGIFVVGAIAGDTRNSLYALALAAIGLPIRKWSMRV
ncbi:MAG TPA: APC family permease [Vicinamibacteria bacterium]|nr:APC family permease [Vicinamibacteria bacterium]